MAKEAPTWEEKRQELHDWLCANEPSFVHRLVNRVAVAMDRQYSKEEDHANEKH